MGRGSLILMIDSGNGTGTCATGGKAPIIVCNSSGVNSIILAAITDADSDTNCGDGASASASAWALALR